MLNREAPNKEPSRIARLAFFEDQVPVLGPQDRLNKGGNDEANCVEAEADDEGDRDQGRWVRAVLRLAWDPRLESHDSVGGKTCHGDDALCEVVILELRPWMDEDFIEDVLVCDLLLDEVVVKLLFCQLLIHEGVFF